jgi:gamma-glutamylcyclotransferase (GGCT)/AIG2-like uncharacterized protein YtfP
MAESYKVFVYGSLKSGFHNNRFLKESEFLGTKYTKETNFMMYSLDGHFPAVVRTNFLEGGIIEGELYEIDFETLIRLDSIESNGEFYEREIIDLEDGAQGWIYLLKDPNNFDLLDDDPQVAIYWNDNTPIFKWEKL